MQKHFTLFYASIGGRGWGGGIGLVCSLLVFAVCRCVGSLAATLCTFSSLGFHPFSFDGSVAFFVRSLHFAGFCLRFSGPVWCCELLSSGIMRFWPSVAWVLLAAQSGLRLLVLLRWLFRVLVTVLCALSYSFSLGFLWFQSAALCHLVLLSLSPLLLLI